MANALQEQLLKAGLASKQKVRDVKTQKKRNRKSNIDDGSAELKAQIAQQKKQQAEKDKALNEQRFAEATEKGLVRGLVTEVKQNAVALPKDGEIKFNYTLENKIYPLYINEKLQNQLLGGRLGIVRIEQSSYLVPHKLAERVNLLVPAWCGYLWQAENNAAQVTDEDDPYADYVIPDDLMW
ncbi:MULTISPECIES: DUF2058 domain-containing protein [Shewanella]|jgi:hypothetical protein|uniref:DUF2058 family protein n=1 Tax=Shewanella chilikensis TaxID=558541 RepID=A0A6G7LSK4_9GAMM|nr:MULTISPECIES: DUF2058 domain-containing protein [Shewanella]MBZ4678945.1 hypothetical protein [Shewanella sp.]MCA0949469.1 DUF2058 domain-containing protein [Shewanella chilikensis]MCE9853703.1 DUF2058 domain-containing protein [Shewanella chilikensis]MCL1153090.1 DUF2058 domain-containing protein [Shewanella chilikensis]MCL1163602.1 DUF2058 domain-containing protein [Shewanella chilikensis]